MRRKHGDLLRRGQALAESEPLLEEAHQEVMRAHLLLGNRPAALATYRALRAEGAAGEPEPGLLLRINQMAQRSGAPPSIKELARTLGISPSHLRARFRASCGVSIGRHLRRLRLEQACGHLRLGPQRVSEIAELCGFSSIYSFSRAFRVTYGVSPLAFRHSGKVAPGRRRPG